MEYALAGAVAAFIVFAVCATYVVAWLWRIAKTVAKDWLDRQ